MLTSLVAPLLLSGGFMSVAFRGNRRLCLRTDIKYTEALLSGGLLVLQGFGRLLSLMKMCYYSIMSLWKWK